MNDREKLEQKIFLLRELKIRKAKTNFYEYCKLMQPEFYKDDRPYIKKLCDTLQNFVEDKFLKPDGTPYDNIAISIPPRHGKSYTMCLLSTWILGHEPLKTRLITTSYNDSASKVFSSNTRNIIMQDKILPTDIIFSDIFEGVKIKDGDGSAQKWSLQSNDGDSFFTYMGASLTGGSLTGKGANFIIVDDPHKNAEESLNERIQEEVYSSYVNTFMSRLEAGQNQRAKSIIIHTRWAKGDLIGRITNPEINPEWADWYQFVMRAYDEDFDQMLCEDVLSKKRYQTMKNLFDINIFESNFNQRPMDMAGRLLKDFKTYSELPQDDNKNILFDRHIAYIDTADKGSDFLVAMSGYEYKGDFYVQDIYDSQSPMEVTENEVADFLFENKPQECIVESNNGGRGFMRSVERILETKYKYYKTAFTEKAQTKNKETRILTNYTYVQNHFFFPTNYKRKYQTYYKEVMSYSKDTKAKHDDHLDVTIAIAEFIQDEGGYNIRFI